MWAPWKDWGQKAASEMWVRKMKCGGWTGDGSVGLELRTQAGCGWDPGVAVGGLCRWRKHQGPGRPWRLNSFTVWLNTRCKSRGVECYLQRCPQRPGELRGAQARRAGEFCTLCSHKKAQLFLLGPEGRLYFSQWQANVCKKQIVSLSPWGEACESFLSLQSILWCCMLLSSSTNKDSRVRQEWSLSEFLIKDRCIY